MSCSLLTVRQVQELLPLSSNQIYLLAAKGKLPSIRLGKKLLFREDDIAWIARNGIQSLPEVTKTAEEVQA